MNKARIIERKAATTGGSRLFLRVEIQVPAKGSTDGEAAIDTATSVVSRKEGDIDGIRNGTRVHSRNDMSEIISAAHRYGNYVTLRQESNEMRRTANYPSCTPAHLRVHDCSTLRSSHTDEHENGIFVDTR